MSVATQSLADELAGFLEREGPSSCDAITAGVRRLRMNVLSTLRDDDRFGRSGHGKLTRWALTTSVNGNGNETGISAMSAVEGTPQSSASRWSWERPSASSCVDPVLHEGFKAHYTDPITSVRMCIKCDGGPVHPPLTFNEWNRGEGGEEQRETFENDYRDKVVFGRATAEQLERLRYAFAEEEDD